MKPTAQHIKNRKEWFAALESGDFKQTREVLKKKFNGGFCCLGVACELANLKTKPVKGSKSFWFIFPLEEDFGEENNMSDAQPFASWFAKRFGVTDIQASSIMDIGIAMNDGEEKNTEGESFITGVKTFKEIAREMRKQFRECDALNKAAEFFK